MKVYFSIWVKLRVVLVIIYAVILLLLIPAFFFTSSGGWMRQVADHLSIKERPVETNK